MKAAVVENPQSVIQDFINNFNSAREVYLQAISSGESPNDLLQDDFPILYEPVLFREIDLNARPQVALKPKTSSDDNLYDLIALLVNEEAQERLIAALTTRMQKPNLTIEEAYKTIDAATSCIAALRLSRNMESPAIFQSALESINPKEVVLKKDRPRLQSNNFNQIKEGEELDGSWCFEYTNGNGRTDDASSDFKLLKRHGQVYLFCTKRNEETVIARPVNSLQEVETILKDFSQQPVKEPQNCNAARDIQTGHFVVNGTAKKQITHQPKEERSFRDLLEKLEQQENLTNQDKAQILMIAESFNSQSQSAVAGSYPKRLNLEETKDCLRFLLGGIDEVQDQSFAARLLMCNQEALSKIKSMYGTSNSFADAFFYNAQITEFNKDISVTIGIDDRKPLVDPDLIQKERNYSLLRDEGRTLVKQREKQYALLNSEKYCHVSGGGHDFGLVFGKVETDENGQNYRNVYIQDSTSTKNPDDQSYLNAIDRIYPAEKRDRIEIRPIKTFKRGVGNNGNQQMFCNPSSDSDTGIQSECRFVTILSKDILQALQNNTPAQEIIRSTYTEQTFEKILADQFDALGMNNSAQRNAKAGVSRRYSPPQQPIPETMDGVPLKVITESIALEEKRSREAAAKERQIQDDATLARKLENENFPQPRQTIANSPAYRVRNSRDSGNNHSASAAAVETSTRHPISRRPVTIEQNQSSARPVQHSLSSLSFNKPWFSSKEEIPSPSSQNAVVNPVFGSCFRMKNLRDGAEKSFLEQNLDHYPLMQSVAIYGDNGKNAAALVAVLMDCVGKPEKLRILKDLAEVPNINELSKLSDKTTHQDIHNLISNRDNLNTLVAKFNDVGGAYDYLAGNFPIKAFEGYKNMKGQNDFYQIRIVREQNGSSWKILYPQTQQQLTNAYDQITTNARPVAEAELTKDIREQQELASERFIADNHERWKKEDKDRAASLKPAVAPAPSPQQQPKPRNVSHFIAKRTGEALGSVSSLIARFGGGRGGNGNNSR